MLTVRKIAEGGRLLFGGLFLLSCALALVGAGWLAAQHPGQQPRINPSAATLKATAENLREEAAKLREEAVKLQAALEAERREAESFRWLLTIIVGLGALYSLFQAIYSYVNVAELKAQAQTAIAGVETLKTNTANELKEFEKGVKSEAAEEFRKFRTECEIQFPMFRGFERALGLMSSQLDARLKEATLAGNFYEILDSLGHQEVFYYEKSVASLQFVEVSAPGRLFQVFLGFSRFYFDKYLSDRRRLQTADPSDLARAHYYLVRADQLPGGLHFRVLNMRGYIAVRDKPSKDLREAEELFSRSADLHPAQQCAHYNLAVIDHLRGKAVKNTQREQAIRQFRQAIGQLRKAKSCDNWEDTPVKEKATSLDYNLACGLSQLAELEEDSRMKKDFLEESFQALRAAILVAPGERTELKHDWQPGEDLDALRIDTVYGPEIETLIQQKRLLR